MYKIKIDKTFKRRQAKEIIESLKTTDKPVDFSK